MVGLPFLHINGERGFLGNRGLAHRWEGSTNPVHFIEGNALKFSRHRLRMFSSAENTPVMGPNVRPRESTRQ